MFLVKSSDESFFTQHNDDVASTSSSKLKDLPILFFSFLALFIAILYSIDQFESTTHVDSFLSFLLQSYLCCPLLQKRSDCWRRIATPAVLANWLDAIWKVPDKSLSLKIPWGNCRILSDFCKSSIFKLFPLYRNGLILTPLFFQGFSESTFMGTDFYMVFPRFLDSGVFPWFFYSFM